MSVKTPATLAAPKGINSPDDQDHSYQPAVSPAMQVIERIIEDIAPTDIPVLLVGESGSGKEWVAVQIHRLSARKDEPFVKISCASLTTETLEAWRKQTENNRGKESSPSRGTIFLDEICELDKACQAALLHLLPDGNGVSSGRSVAARIIASSSRNPEVELQAGRVGEKLYYRINGVLLRLPPLRERKQDIPGFVDFFLKKHAALFGRSQPCLSPAALEGLTNRLWPGNIRELENVVRKIVVLGEERAGLADAELSLEEARAKANTPEGISLKEAARAASRRAERELIAKVLVRTHWNRKRAAQELQISYKALLYKLKQMNLDDPTAA